MNSHTLFTAVFGALLVSPHAAAELISLALFCGSTGSRVLTIILDAVGTKDFAATDSVNGTCSDFGVESPAAFWVAAAFEGVPAALEGVAPAVFEGSPAGCLGLRLLTSSCKARLA